MNKCAMIGSLALLLVMGMSASAMAQDKPLGTVGIGVSIDANSLLGNSSTFRGSGGIADVNRASVLIPLNLIPNLRIEPLLGFSYSTNEVQSEPGEPQGTVEFNRFGFTAGVGGFYTFRPSAVTNVYAGARIAGSTLNDSSEVNAGGVKTDTTITRLDIIVEPVIGGEYHFSPHFALGAEFKIPVNLIGEAARNVNDADDVNEPGGLTINTSTALVARFYFN